MVNLGAWLLVSALCVESASASVEEEAGVNARVARWMLLCASLLPIVMKAATTAMADAFTMLVVALSLTLLIAWPRLGRGGAMALGFAAFAGLTTRYQAAAVAIVITAIVFVDAVRHAERRYLIGGYFAGAVFAAIAAAPFYVANVITLGSATWPFGAALTGGSRGISAVQAGSEIARIAATCSARALTGDWAARIASAGRLLVHPSVFPIPVLLVIGALVTLVRGPARLRIVGVFVFGFLAIWMLAQPRLEPRFSVFLVFAAIVCLVPSASILLRSSAALPARVAAFVVTGALAAVAALYSWDYLRLAATGDVARFHRATWYWPAYEWANRNTPDDSRFLVILYGGHTYPLDRWNLSGDPGSSAAVPWERIRDGCELGAFLRSNRATFVFYGPNVWTGGPLTEHAGRVVAEAASGGVLVPVRRFAVPIVYGRMARLERTANIALYRVDTARATGACRIEAPPRP